jgi:hybrid cluster-associated redox disulfide protein
MSFSLHDLVDDVMCVEPDTIRVFLQHKMGCVGCPIATFHTVEDACREHGIDCDAFLRALHGRG